MASKDSSWRYQTKTAIFYPKNPSPGRKSRISVYLPEQVSESLNIAAGDSDILFAENPKIPYVVLTKAKDAQKAFTPLGADETDPQYQVAVVLKELIDIEANEIRLELDFRHKKIDGPVFLKEKSLIRQRRERIGNVLGELLKERFRGEQPDVDELESIHIASLVSELSEGAVSYVETLLSDFERHSERLEGLKALLVENLIDAAEYSRIRTLTESRLKLIDNSIEKIVNLLNARPVFQSTR